jgi:vancomycin resistance protein VanW
MNKIYVKAVAKQSTSTVSYPYGIFSHRTPLFRELKDSELWMQENKIHNLNIAIKSLNNTVIEPGQVLSYWKMIGAPMFWRGFKKGMVLVNGHVQGRTGGGLCQLSNLIYWMTLHSPLTVTERFRHSFDVFPDSSRTQPFGSGATCVYKYRDLQIRNDYIVPLKLHLWIEGDYLNGEWLSPEPLSLSYEVYEKKHWISQAGAGCYIRNNILYRKTFSRNKFEVDEYIAENHALMMYSPLLSEPQTFTEKN